MVYDPNIHHRCSRRLRGYDYTRPGAYFITICTYKHQYLFGNITNKKMILNDYGQIVADEWEKTARIRPRVALDAWVVMPDHFHGIIVIKNDGGDAICGGMACVERFGKPVPGSVPTIIRSFKSAVTKRVNALRNTPGAPVWQNNYDERIIKNVLSLNRIREYIMQNPANWKEDQLCTQI